MKHIYTFILALLLLLPFYSKSQCTQGTSAGTIIPQTTWQTQGITAGSPYYYNFFAAAGVTYTFTYCQGGGSYSGDPYLTVSNAGPTALQWNDDFCSLGSEVIWTCMTTGQHRIYLSGCCPCSNAPSATMAYRASQNSCSLNVQAVSGGNTVFPQICAGSSLMLTSNAISNYSWSNGATTPSITVSPTVNTVYTLTAMSPSNCIVASTIAVNVNTSSPVLSVNTISTNICLGMVIALQASGANTYTWNTGTANGGTIAPQTNTTYIVSGQNGCGTSTAAVNISVTPLQVVTIASPTIVCSGSSATINIAAAASNFTINPLGLTSQTGSFVVSPTIATIFTVTASNGTCAGTSTLSISTIPIPTVSIACSSSVTCAGAPITMTASGGISYTWNPGNLTTPIVTVSPNGPTLFSVVASNALGCTASANQVILTSVSPSVNVSSNANLICTGGNVILTASGAGSYSWSTGATTATISVSPNQTSIYTVTGTQNTCSDTKTISVAVFVPTLAISGPTAICKGQSASLTASPADSYTWSNGTPFSGISVSPSITTVYSVSALTSSGSISCPSTASVNLIVNPLPTITAVASKTSVCRGQSFTITASGASSYSWNTGATSSSLVTSSTLVANVNYTVSGTDANGCSNATVITIKVNSCIGIEETQNSGFSLFPNPNSGILQFKSDQKNNYTLRIHNSIGQVIFMSEVSSDARIDMRSYKSGLYYIEVLNGTIPVYKQNIIKE